MCTSIPENIQTLIGNQAQKNCFIPSSKQSAFYSEKTHSAELVMCVSPKEFSYGYVEK